MLLGSFRGVPGTQGAGASPGLPAPSAHSLASQAGAEPGVMLGLGTASYK